MKWFLATYLLALAANAANSSRPQFLWEGDVEDSAVLILHKEQALLKPGEGIPVRNPKYRFYSKLPDHTQLVRVEVMRGRGTVRVVSQPRLDNDYSATIRIEDPQPGPSHYAIAVRWEVSPYDEPAEKRTSKKNKKDKNEPACCDPEQTPVVNAIGWTGHVDGAVRVTILGSSSSSQVLSGNLTNEYPRVDRPLPRRGDLKYTVSKVSGGGEVALIESPSPANGYVLVFEVRNNGSQDRDYAVSIGWGPGAAAPQPARR